jgi:putative transposase
MTTTAQPEKYLRRTPAQWQAIVDDFLVSNLSAPEFCKQKNIQYSNFSKWRKRLSDEVPIKENSVEVSSSFIDVSTLIDESQNWNITLKLGNGVELILSQS